MNGGFWLIIAVIALALGIGVGYLIRQMRYARELRSEQLQAEGVLGAAKEEAHKIELQAKDKALEIRQTADAEIARRRAELIKEEDRLQKRREEIDERTDRVDKREQTLNKRQSVIDRRANEIEKMHSDELEVLQKISQMTQEEARG
ncbi:MAG TPA: Rnase Y domain-containing protein, partial [Acidobacteriota bacterium]|nr:Rnase Y domain-containing protein [Acidobacteriota bacterium]